MAEIIAFMAMKEVDAESVVQDTYSYEPIEDEDEDEEEEEE